MYGGAVVEMISKPVLFICPYCSTGRFTGKDDFELAKKHIKEKHRNGDRSSTRRRRPTTRNYMDGDEELFAETEFE